MRSLRRTLLHVAPLALLVARPAFAKTDSLPDYARQYLSLRHDVIAHVSPRGVRTEALKLRLVPSFARQTGLACSVCHYQFPQLTAFGRQFKLNGYTLSGQKPIEDKDKHDKSILQLLPFSPVSLMMEASATQLASALPGTQNFTVALPQQLGVLWAGAISSKLGTMSQVTWVPSAGTFAIDNVDVRYADHGTVGATALTWGVTLNNNPSTQDLWNTTPAWGYPFASSGTAPSPLGAPMIMGGLAQRSVGVGAYAMANDLVYAELAAYRSAIPAEAAPLDSSVRGAIAGATPYWRLGLQKKFGNQYLMVGTFGLSSKQYPEGVSGLTNRYTDVAIDAQHETPLGSGNLVTRVAWIHESQSLTASYLAPERAAAGRTANLTSLRASSSWYPSQTVGLTAAVFSTSGTVDTLQYAPGSVTGSANGKPQTSGGSLEASYNLWENARLSATYTMFNRYNGGSTNYDGSGRNATGNNTLYLLWWFAF